MKILDLIELVKNTEPNTVVVSMNKDSNDELKSEISKYLHANNNVVGGITRTEKALFAGKTILISTVIPNGEMNFGEAIEALKQGKKVCRSGWNGKGMYLKLINGYPVNGHLQPADVNSKTQGQTQGKSGQMLSHIVMKTAGDSLFWGHGYSDYVPWLASQTDVLAEDWGTVD